MSDGKITQEHIITPTPSILLSYNAFANPKDVLDPIPSVEIKHEREINARAIASREQRKQEVLRNKQDRTSHIQGTSTTPSVKMETIPSFSTSAPRKDGPLLDLAELLSNSKPFASPLPPATASASASSFHGISSRENPGTKPDISMGDPTSNMLPMCATPPPLPKDYARDMPLTPQSTSVGGGGPRRILRPHTLSHPPSHAGDEEEAKLKAFYRKTEKLEAEAARKQAQMLLKILSGGLETTTDLLQFNAIKLKNLAKNTQLGLSAGNFDLSIKAFVEDPDYIRWLKDPVTSFSTAFIDIMMDTHLQNTEKELEMGLKGTGKKTSHRPRHRHHRSHHRHRSPTPSDSYTSSTSEDEEEPDSKKKKASSRSRNKHYSSHHPRASNIQSSASALHPPSSVVATTTISTQTLTSSSSSIGPPSASSSSSSSSSFSSSAAAIISKPLQPISEEQGKYGWVEEEGGKVHTPPPRILPSSSSTLSRRVESSAIKIDGKQPPSAPTSYSSESHSLLTTTTSTMPSSSCCSSSANTSNTTHGRKVRPFCPKPVACALPDLSKQIERFTPLMSTASEFLQEKEAIQASFEELDSTRPNLF